MKKLLSLLLALVVTLSCGWTAIAESTAQTSQTTDETQTVGDGEETGEATNPYVIEALGTTIALPSNIHVTNEQSSDDAIVIDFSLDGRQDCSLNLTITYNEAYEPYYAASLPQEMLDEMLSYYNGLYTNPNGKDAAYLLEGESDIPELTPVFVYGQDASGNYYMIYVSIFYGYQFTVSLGSSSEIDEESIGSVYNLYWQTIEMLSENFFTKE